jgi:hypothetical protein
MIFPHPVTLKEAMETRAARAILPTDMSAKMLSSLPREVRERAIFSAGVQNVDFLERAKEAIDKMVEGVTDRATQRTALRALADRFDMSALQSDSRLNLILDTQVKMANGFGNFIEGQHPSILLMWPAQELYRAEERKEPRDWPARWEEAGGEFFPDDFGNCVNWTTQSKNDLIICLDDKELWSPRVSWLLSNAYLQGVEWDDNALQIDLSSEVSKLQRSRNFSLLGVAEQLPSLSERYGRQAKGNDHRTSRWIEGVLSGELSLGNDRGTEHQPSHEPFAYLERKDASALSLGNRERNNIALHPRASSRWLVSRKGSDSACRTETTLSNADYAAGRMIALKTDPIWTDISAFDLPYAPFDYNSGMDLRDIDRDEAVDLGLIDEDDTQNPEELSFNHGLQAAVGISGKFGLGFALGQFLGDLASVNGEGIVKFLGQ